MRAFVLFSCLALAAARPEAGYSYSRPQGHGSSGGSHGGSGFGGHSGSSGLAGGFGGGSIGGVFFKTTHFEFKEIVKWI